MKCFFLATILVALAATSAMASGDLQNGNFDNWPTGLVAPNWTGAYSATVANQFVREATIVKSAPYSQKTKAKDAAGAWAHVYQGIDTNVGDALTISGWFYSLAVPTGTRPRVGVNTSSTRPSTWLLESSTFTRNQWTATGALSCKAAGTSTYLFLESGRVGAVDTTICWDDFSLFHAYVPLAAALGGATTNSLSLDIAPGSNAAGAEFAIGVGGGAFGLGTNWLQGDGTVGTTAAWLTDAGWATKVVTGLAADTSYSFQAKCRYSSTYATETDLGAIASMSTLPIPEPSSMLALLAGLPIMGFAVRRRKA